MNLRRALCLFALSASAAAQTAATRSLADADRAWEVSFHNLKLTEIMSVVAPDAILMEPNMPMSKGTENITNAYKEVTSIPGLDFSWKMAHVQVTGDLGFTDGLYTFSFKDPTGKPVLDKGKYLTVWHRDKAGKWWVIRDMFSSDLPMPK